MCQVRVKSLCISSFDSDSNFIKYEELLYEVQGGLENGKSRFESWAIYGTAYTPNTAVPAVGPTEIVVLSSWWIKVN